MKTLRDYLEEDEPEAPKGPEEAPAGPEAPTEGPQKQAYDIIQAFAGELNQWFEELKADIRRERGTWEDWRSRLGQVWRSVTGGGAGGVQPHAKTPNYKFPDEMNYWKDNPTKESYVPLEVHKAFHDFYLEAGGPAPAPAVPHAPEGHPESFPAGTAPPRQSRW